MRKFLVYYRRHLIYGEHEYNYSEIELDDGEKANVVTFGKKLNSIGCGGEEVLSWCLIEE